MACPQLMSALPDVLSQYGTAYQRDQAAKFRARRTNHWRQRIALAFDLVERHALPRLGNVPRGAVHAVDVGCSIGTFAIECALRGFRATGIDLDPSALAIALELASEEGVSPAFFCADLAQWEPQAPIDIAIAFDIFEHLHDDQVGAMLATLRRMMSPQGSLVFHTFPTEFDYIFFENNGALAEPLLPFAAEPPGDFERRTRALAARLEAETIQRGGLPRRDAIRTEQHCNPTGRRRLKFILERAGFDPIVLETAHLYEWSRDLADRFRGQPIVDRNLYGIAVPRT